MILLSNRSRKFILDLTDKADRHMQVMHRALMLALGATPEEFDSVWERIRPLPLADTPEAAVVLFRQALAEVRAGPSTP